MSVSCIEHGWRHAYDPCPICIPPPAYRKETGMSDNGLRDENGGLIGGLIVEDYNAGYEGAQDGNPPPHGLTSPSYDLGRQRYARDLDLAATVRKFFDDQDARTDKAMREMLPPEAYAEYRSKIDAIRALTPTGGK